MTVRMTRRHLLGMTAGAAALGLVGCGGDDSTSSNTTTANTGGTKPTVKPASTVKYWSVHPGGSKDVETELINRFQAKYPDIKVNMEDAGANYADISTKFNAGLAAGQIPDVVMLSDVWWFKYFLAQTITPLDDLMNQAQVDTSDYADTLIKDYQFQGKQWAMPFARSTPLFYYNKDKWNAAGLPDRGPANWDEMDQWGPKLMAKAGSNEHAFTHVTGQSYSAWTFEAINWEFGGRYSDDKFNILLNSQESIDAGNYVRSQIFEKKYANVTAKDEQADFSAGATASMISSTGGLTGVIKNAKFQVGTAFLPTKKQFGCPTGGAGLAIPASIPKENQYAAMLFIKFLTEPESTAYYSQNVGYMPVRKSAATGPLMAEFFTKNPQFKTAVDQLAKTQSQDTARVYIPGGDAIIGKGLDAILLNNQDAKSVWPDVKKQLEDTYNSDVKPKLKA